MRKSAAVRRAVLATGLTLLLIGITGSIDAAQAMPAAAPLLSQGPASTLTTVQYDGRDGYGRHRRPIYRYHGRAGLYRCGPYGQRTHLERQVCH